MYLYILIYTNYEYRWIFLFFFTLKDKIQPHYVKSENKILHNRIKNKKKKKRKKTKKRAIPLNRRITSDLGQQRNGCLSVSVSSGVGAVKRILLGCPAINFAGFRRTGQKNRPRDSWNREPISDLALFSKPLFSARCRSN